MHSVWRIWCSRMTDKGLKVSYHLVYPWLVFPCNTTMLREEVTLMSDMEQFQYHTKNGDLKSFIDPAVYTNNRQFHLCRLCHISQDHCCNCCHHSNCQWSNRKHWCVFACVCVSVSVSVSVSVFGSVSVCLVRKPDFSARIRKLSANVENFPQTGSGQERTHWDPAEASIISCHAQACPCASFLTAA